MLYDNVDLTPPTVYFLETPPALSNQITSSNFRFRCSEYRLSGCTYLCDVHRRNENPQFQPCFGSFLFTNLESGVSYVFTVIASDGVGNVGNPVTYLWKIGKNYWLLSI